MKISDLLQLGYIPDYINSRAAPPYIQFTKIGRPRFIAYFIDHTAYNVLLKSFEKDRILHTCELAEVLAHAYEIEMATYDI